MAIGSEIIAGKIGSLIDNVPSSINTATVALMVENAKILVENLTGNSINLADIGSSHQGVLMNLGAAHVLSRMTGIGTDFDYQIGNFRVEKGREEDPNSKQIQFFLNMANMQMPALGMPIRFDRTNPTL